MEYFIRFSKHAALLIDLTLDAAALIGFMFIFRALIKLKIYGEMRSMMTPHARMNHILLLLVAGVLLVYLPHTTRPLLMDAFLGTPTIKDIPYHSGQSLTTEMQQAVTWVMKLIGHIALVRGIVQLGTYQEGGRHSLGKSLTHIMGGVCAINIHQTSDLLKTLIGVE
jgi:intracellular multiplication protein IcmC